MFDFRVFDVVIFSVTFWTLLQGIVAIAAELLYSIIPVTFCGVILLAIFIYSCRIPAPSQAAVEAVVGKDPLSITDQDDQMYVMRAVAHRGAGLDAPENSLVAFKMCAERNCSAVEFDVSMSSDNVPIIFHDDTLERLADSNKEIRKMTWSELSTIDISVKHPLKDKFKTTCIAQLEETIQQCVENNQRMFIDIKEFDLKIVKIILNLYNKYPALFTSAVCSSFHPKIIYMIRRANPKIVCSLAWRPYVFANDSYTASTGKGRPRSNIWFIQLFYVFLDILMEWALPRVLYHILGISLILLHKDVVSGDVVYKWRNRGVRVIAWTVNHPVEKQHFSRNLKVTYITDTLIGESSAHLMNRK